MISSLKKKLPLALSLVSGLSFFALVSPVAAQSQVDFVTKPDIVWEEVGVPQSLASQTDNIVQGQVAPLSSVIEEPLDTLQMNTIDWSVTPEQAHEDHLNAKEDQKVDLVEDVTSQNLVKPSKKPSFVENRASSISFTTQDALNAAEYSTTSKPSVISQDIMTSAVEVKSEEQPSENIQIVEGLAPNETVLEDPASFSEMNNVEALDAISPASGMSYTNQEGFYIRSSETLNEILMASYVNNPALQSAREALQISHESVFQAEAGWLPTVSLDADITRLDQDSSPGDEFENTTKGIGLSLQQPLFRSGRTVNATAREVWAAQRDYNLYIAQVQDIMLDAITAYTDVVQAKAELGLNESNVTRLKREAQSVSQQFEVGQLTRTDVSQSRARVASAESSFISAQGALNNALSVFKQITGLDMPVESFEEIDINTVSAPQELSDAIAYAKENHPDVVASDYAIKSSDFDIKAQYSDLLPDVSFNSALQRRYDPHPGTLNDQSSFSFGVQASLPIYSAGVERSQLRQAKINKSVNTYDRMDTIRMVESDVTRAWQDIQTASSNQDASERQLQAAQIARNGVYSEREVGTRTVLDALDADQELLDAQVAVVNAQRDHVLSHYRLMEAIGALKPENIGFKRLISEKENLTQMEGVFDKLFTTSPASMDN